MYKQQQCDKKGVIMKKLFLFRVVLILVITIGGFLFIFSYKESTVEAAQSAPDLKAMEKMIQRNQDYIEVQNLMSRRAFYHGATWQPEELKLYANRPDISFGMNDGFRVGMEKIKAVYETRFNQTRAKDAARIAKLFPDQVKGDESSWGVGMMQMHTLTTPIIEIAGDGQTAKGMWYTPGVIGSVDQNGKVSNSWIWEKYAVDFIKEDGKWKFWHILVSTDFSVGFAKTLGDEPGRNVAPQGAEGALKQAQPASVPKDVPKVIGKTFSATRVATVYPPMPEPYETFSKTFSYGPEIAAWPEQ
jgi:hypothetical protein